MSALTGFLALGTLDPVTGAFSEATYAGYARQAISFALDVPSAGGAVQTGGVVLRNDAAVAFPAPTGLDWPKINAFAVHAAVAGGDPLLISTLGGHSGIHQRSTVRTFRAGFFVLDLPAGTMSCRLGGVVATAGLAVVVLGQLVFVTGAGVVAAASGGVLDFSDPANSALAGG